MRVYHSTTFEAAEHIRRDGFRDAEGSYGFAHHWPRGVFVAKVPANENDGAKGQDVVFAINVPDDVLEPFWFWEDPSGTGEEVASEACVPAAVLNRYSRLTVAYDEDQDD